MIGSDASAPNGDDTHDSGSEPRDSGSNTPLDATVRPDAADADATPALPCPQILQAFNDFVAANRACNVDTDCTVIGDCGPHNDWTPVNVSAASAGYALMLEREPCGIAGFDGEGYRPSCQGGQCTQGSTVVQVCCGCPPDAGLDGG